LLVPYLNLFHCLDTEPCRGTLFYDLPCLQLHLEKILFGGKEGLGFVAVVADILLLQCLEEIDYLEIQDKFVDVLENVEILVRSSANLGPTVVVEELEYSGGSMDSWACSDSSEKIPGVLAEVVEALVYVVEEAKVHVLELVGPED